MDRLNGRIIPRSALNAEQIERMYELMTIYYDGVCKEKFVSDLYEKEWVLLLEDNISKTIQGFTTMVIMRTISGGALIRAVFSGDTIIDKNFRGQLELVKIWLDFALNVLLPQENSKLYWFLISKGYKTYKLFPLFFLRFYPGFNQVDNSEMKKILDALALKKFPSEYDAAQGIIRPEEADRLKCGREEITGHKLQDPHIKFFIEKNPNFWKGEELCCLLEISWDNLTGYGKKLVKPKI